MVAGRRGILGQALDEFAGAGYRVISYDARGHGDSDWAAEGDYRTDAMVADGRSSPRCRGRRC